jgi:hypothetical protein
MKPASPPLEQPGRRVMVRSRGMRALVGGIALAVLASGCGTPHGSPAASLSESPTGAPASLVASAPPGGIGFAWDAASVEGPAAVTDAPSAAPRFCSPCHGQATLLFGVARTGFGLVAVGVQEPPAKAAAWLSPDGRQWARVAGFPAADGSVAVAVAANAERSVVVGSDRDGALSWVTTDGATWAQSPPAPTLAGPSGGTHMLTVVAWQGGFVAGGSHDDPIAGHTSGAIWLSSDGLAWRRVSADASFAGTRVLGLAAGENTLVAVGTSGDETHGNAVVWVSHDGLRWDRLASPALNAGIMRAVTADSAGFEAVGLGSADDQAEAWVSRDGNDWQVVPDSTALHVGHLSMRMFAVAPSDVGLVAVGWKSDAGNGSGAAWISPDGIRWQRSPDLPTFYGAEVTGVVSKGPGLVGVGTSGYPDNDIASVWTSGP